MIATIPTLASHEALLRLALAALLGAAIGIEREISEHEAGLRTHMIVSLGSCLFTLASAYGFRDFLVAGGAAVRADPTRIATTAATLWVVAAIGLTTGAGYYSAALITTGLVVLSLWPLRIITRRFLGRPRERRLSIELAGDAHTSGVIETLERSGVEVSSFSAEETAEGRRFSCVIELSRSLEPALVVGRLLVLRDVRSASWIDEG